MNYLQVVELAASTPATTNRAPHETQEDYEARIEDLRNEMKLAAVDGWEWITRGAP